MSAHGNKTIDFIIRNLPADNDRYYIEDEKGFNRFKILEDPQQEEKDKFFELILNTKQKMSGFGCDLEKVELKCIKNWAFSMLEDLGETYVNF